jgi:hypothetical protein
LDGRPSVELNRAKQPGYLSDFAALATQANYGCVSRTRLP